MPGEVVTFNIVRVFILFYFFILFPPVPYIKTIYNIILTAPAAMVLAVIYSSG